MERTLLLGLGFFLLMGCHSANGGGGAVSINVSGSVGGEGLEFLDVGSFATKGVITGGNFSEVTIAATSKSGACGWADESNLARANLTSFFILIQHTGSTPQDPIGPGTYTVMPGSAPFGDAGGVEAVNASLGTTDAMCNPVGFNGVQAEKGTVTLTAVTASEITGSFDVSFYGMGDHLAGSFSAPTCANVSAGTEAGACHP